MRDDGTVIPKEEWKMIITPLPEIDETVLLEPEATPIWFSFTSRSL